MKIHITCLECGNKYWDEYQPSIWQDNNVCEACQQAMADHQEHILTYGKFAEFIQKDRKDG